MAHSDGNYVVESVAAFGCEFVLLADEIYLWYLEERGIDVTPRRGADWSAIRKSSSRVLAEEACGWPWLCLRWHISTSWPGGPMSSAVLHGAIELGEQRDYRYDSGFSRTFPCPVPADRTLPLLPIWPGLLLNMLFYAAVLWLLICGPFALRRFIRIRRSLCPACAYPTGESVVCSECGNALPGRAEAAT